MCANSSDTLPLSEKKILFVGLACLDIVMTCETYPEEDSDLRCKSQRWSRGGNASNNSTIFAECDIPCEYLGTLSQEYGGGYLKESFGEHGISIEHCKFYDDCECPTSVVITNSSNGSRTIMHSNRNLPELSFEDFLKLNLNAYHWIHFEGRNEENVKKFTDYIEEWNMAHPKDKITVSIEIEKPNPKHKKLLSCGDYVFISKDFARICGCDSMEMAVEILSEQIKPGCSSGGCCLTMADDLTLMASDGDDYCPAFGDMMCAGQRWHT